MIKKEYIYYLYAMYIGGWWFNWKIDFDCACVCVACVRARLRTCVRGMIPQWLGSAPGISGDGAPAPGGEGAGVLELSGVQLAEIFTVSPKRCTQSVCLDLTEAIFGGKSQRKRPNAGLTAWPAGGGAPVYLVGAAAEMEQGTRGADSTRVRMEQSAEQLRASSDVAGAGALTSCTLFLGGQRPRRSYRLAQGATAPGPTNPAGADTSGATAHARDGVARGNGGISRCRTDILYEGRPDVDDCKVVNMRG